MLVINKIFSRNLDKDLVNLILIIMNDTDFHNFKTNHFIIKKKSKIKNL